MSYFSVDSPQVFTEFPKHVWETPSNEHRTAVNSKISQFPVVGEVRVPGTEVPTGDSY